MHLKNRQGLLFLRNPASEAATATLHIERDVMLHEPGHASCQLNGIYPHENQITRTADRNDTVNIQMEPDSVMAFDLKVD